MVERNDVEGIDIRVAGGVKHCTVLGAKHRSKAALWVPRDE
jgi:hypothetical protein